MKRVLSVVLIVGVAAAAVVLSGQTASGSGSGTIKPLEGKYVGHDDRHGDVYFELRGNQMMRFRVFRHGETHFGGAHVSGERWHHTCADGRCTRGNWKTNRRVEGFWNIPSQGGDVAFVAHWAGH